jgi:hypothetical protein
LASNIATTEGAVVFENEMMQLIQYTPLTPKVGTRADAGRTTLYQQVLHHGFAA